LTYQTKATSKKLLQKLSQKTFIK